jgi:hypothetical protein
LPEEVDRIKQLREVIGPQNLEGERKEMNVATIQKEGWGRWIRELNQTWKEPPAQLGFDTHGRVTLLALRMASSSSIEAGSEAMDTKAGWGTWCFLHDSLKNCLLLADMTA